MAFFSKGDMRSRGNHILAEQQGRGKRVRIVLAEATSFDSGTTGLGPFFASMNKLLSKFAHPTAMTVFSFPDESSRAQNLLSLHCTRNNSLHFFDS